MKRLYLLLAVVLFVVILIMPMILQNDIVQTIKVSSDMATHLSIVKGDGIITPMYFGQILLSWLLKPFASSDSLPTIYLWLNFAVLIAVAGSLYYIVGNLVNRWASYLVVPCAMFASTGIIALFKYGVIFDIINMGIIMPFAVYFLIRWLSNKTWWYAIPSVVLFALFSMFHYTGLYLPYAVGGFLVLYVVHGLFKHRWDKWKLAVSFGVFIVAINLMLWRVFAGNAISPISDYAQPLLPISDYAQPLSSPEVARSFSLFLSALWLIPVHLSIIITLALVVGIVVWYMYRREVKVSTQTGLFMAILLSFTIVLVGGLFLMVTPDYNRLALDLASILVVITACLWGIIAERLRSNTLNVGMALFIIIAIVPNLIAWLSL